MAGVEYFANDTSIVATVYSDGRVLKRDTDGSYIAAVAADTALTAVLLFDLGNTGAAQVSFAFRPIIGGDVRRDLLRMGTAAITNAQADMLRDYGIFAAATTDTSRSAP